MKEGELPAFPCQTDDKGREFCIEEGIIHRLGLTKREWIATRFMGAFLHAKVEQAIDEGKLLKDQTVSVIARSALHAADVLLKELEGNGW